jgi:hypothetical protein
LRVPAAVTRASGPTQSVVVVAVVGVVAAAAEIAGLVAVVVARELHAGQELAEECAGLLYSRLVMRWPAVVADPAMGTRYCVHGQLECSDRRCNDPRRCGG